MSGKRFHIPKIVVCIMLLTYAYVGWAQTTGDRLAHDESAAQHQGAEASASMPDPKIPEGMTLDEVFEFAESPPPENFPTTIADDRLYAFMLVEQMEYRISADDETEDHLGWEFQGWIGTDYSKFWWKHEGESAFEGPDEGETETDLLYSRLCTPFWSLQVGGQYANEWHEGDYEDRWSGVIALQGLAPYKLELDNALYISEDGDVTFATEAEYDLRITQRLVLQPRAEMGVSFQDIPERSLGSGITNAKLDLRLRYEFRREFAPYVGVRYQFLVGETDNIAEAGGRDTEQVLFLAGLRFAF